MSWFLNAARTIFEVVCAIAEAELKRLQANLGKS